MDAESHLKIFPETPKSKKLHFVNRQILALNNYPEQPSIAIEDVRKRTLSQIAISHDVSSTQKFQNRNIIKPCLKLIPKSNAMLIIKILKKGERQT